MDDKSLTDEEILAADGDQSFDQMLEASFAPQKTIEPGEKIAAKVISIGEEFVFLDVGTRDEGLLLKAEVTTNGELTVAKDDKITVFVSGTRDGAVLCTRRLGAGEASDRKGDQEAILEDLKEAYQSGIPVQGTVSESIKGGFSVTLMGQRAFCPISQIDKAYCDNPELHVGQTYGFAITQFEENGRNIVISRRKLLEAEAAEFAAVLWDKLAVGDVCEGKVSSIKNYGAFVDIGGIEGLLHVSEMAYTRVGDPNDQLQVGQQLKVSIKELDPQTQKVSLSLKALLADPWDDATNQLTAGKVYEGRVVRLAKFGAFVELLEGVEGLVHISQFGVEKRIHHPREVVAEGDQVEVRILEIDVERRRISLTMATDEKETFTPSQLKDSSHKGMGTLGDLFGAALKKK